MGAPLNADQRALWNFKCCDDAEQEIAETAIDSGAPKRPILPLHEKPLAIARTYPIQSRRKKALREKKKRDYQTIINWLQEQAQANPEFEEFQASFNRRLKNPGTVARWRFVADFFRNYFDVLPPDHVVSPPGNLHGQFAAHRLLS